jgi:hypothetical protein
VKRSDTKQAQVLGIQEAADFRRFLSIEAVI